MYREKTKAGKGEPVRQPAAKTVIAAKGYTAVTQFMLPPAAKHTAGNALPKQLKNNIEGLSGLPMDDVQVHYNSPEPARIGALASAKGNKIDLGPRQEKHLPHEAWHVVQQKQGRVKPTLQAKGLAINDDNLLETEADIMGQKAMQLKTASGMPLTHHNQVVSPGETDVVQRKVGFEFQAKNSILITGLELSELPLVLGKPETGAHFSIEADKGASKKNAELEIETPAFEETAVGRTHLIQVIDNVVKFVKKIEDGQPLKRIKEVKWFNLEEEQEEKKEEEKDYKVKFKIKKGTRFAPQATVGVKFEKISDLIEAVTAAPFKTGGKAIDTAPASEGLLETKEPQIDSLTGIKKFANIFGWNAMDTSQAFNETSKAGLNKAKKIFPDPQDAKLVGLAAILLGLAFHANGPVQPKMKGHIKYWMPFMLRNGFLPYYNNMTVEQKTRFAAGFKDDEKLAQTDIAKSVENISNSISIETILDGLLNGKDALVDTKVVIVHGKITDDKENKEGYYETWEMKSVDDVG
jgi:hypothetical protein